MSLPQGTALFLLVAGTADVVCLLWQLGFYGHFLHRPWPYNSPLLDQIFGGDLTAYASLFHLLHTGDFFTFRQPIYEYPAPVALLYALFLSFKHPVLVFELSILGVALLAAGLFAWRLSRTATRLRDCVCLALGTFALSYPLAFELKQVNMEPWVVLLVGAGVWCFWRRRFHAAAGLFGAAAAMKIFPFIYFGLLLQRRRYAALLTAVLVAASLTLISLRFLSPHPLSAWHSIGANLEIWQQDVVLRVRKETGFDHSFFGALKQGIFLLHRQSPSTRHLQWLLTIYMLFAAGFGVLIWFLRVVRLPFANQVLCLSVCSILLPPNSYDYTLLHLYIAGGVLALKVADVRTHSIPGLKAAFVCLALATSLQGELIWHGYVFGGQFKAAVLVSLLWITLRYPFPDSMPVSPPLRS